MDGAVWMGQITVYMAAEAVILSHEAWPIRSLGSFIIAADVCQGLR